MRAVLLGLVGVSAIMAWALAQRRSDHRPIAWLLSVGFFGDAMQWALSVHVIAPLRTALGEGPWTGWADVAGCIVDAVWLAWPAAVLGAAIKVYTNWSTWLALAGWALALAATRSIDAEPGGVLTAAQATAAAISVAIATAWLRRCRTAEPISPARAVLTFLIAHELVSLLAARWVGPFARWHVLQGSILLVLAVVIALQGRSLWATKLSLSSSP
jgi:hypothetical protein